MNKYKDIEPLLRTCRKTKENLTVPLFNEMYNDVSDITDLYMFIHGEAKGKTRGPFGERKYQQVKDINEKDILYKYLDKIENCLIHKDTPNAHRNYLFILRKELRRFVFKYKI